MFRNVERKVEVKEISDITLQLDKIQKNVCQLLMQ